MIQYGYDKRGKFSFRKLWRSVTIKTDWNYHYLSKRLQAMWKMQPLTMLIDIPNDFYIVKSTNEPDYSMALFYGPWMIGDPSLHVQCCRPNFMVKTAQIDLLPVCGYVFLFCQLSIILHLGYRE